MMLRTTILCVTMIASTHSVADYRGENASNGRWGVNIESLTINKDTALDNSIDEQAYGLGFDYTGVFGSYFNINLGATFLKIEDEGRFKQPVINTTTREESTKSSSIDAGALHVEFGPQFSFAKDNRITMGLNVGYRYFDADREISNCDDCKSQSIEIDNDTYLKPFIAARLTTNFILGLTYTVYNDELRVDNSAQIKFEWRSK